jgi:hypothetical protein
MFSNRKINSMEFDVYSTHKEIIPWCGMFFLKKMLDKKGFKAQNIKSEVLPQAQSNSEHKVRTILEPFITSIRCVANRFMHTEVTRHLTTLDFFFIGILFLNKIPISDFLIHLIKQQIKNLIIIFILGYSIISN